MAGRPTKYTPEAVKIITDAIKEGLSFRDSCAMAGISEDTFADWRKRATDKLPELTGEQAAKLDGAE